ncbi:FecR domain-containing protein [Reichenbachiella sp. MALMAid0571]|uniref:FecR family protein n=1 Tax=Reichenbachiella sp. MALMAid0571 TaxID=3143939 RepID=UPI0032DE38C7
MKNKKFHLLTSKFFSGEIQEHEQTELDQMLLNDSYKKQFNELQHVWETALNEKDSFNIASGKQMTAQKIAKEDSSFAFEKGRIYLRESYIGRVFMKVAASITLILSLGYLYVSLNSQQNNQNNVVSKSSWKVTETASGQLSTITFSDGSKAVLNGESKLSRPSIFNDSLRVVELEGEAYFEIAKDKTRPFIVRTRDVSTKVLGTKFNVHAFPDESNVNVSLLEGSVEVFSNLHENKKNEHFLLRPNEQVVINTSTRLGQISSVDLGSIVGWKDNIFAFDNVKLEEVLKAIKRRYGVEFIVKNKKINNCLIKTNFKNASLEAMLEAITFATSSRYEIKNEQIIITGKGCQN